MVREYRILLLEDSEDDASLINRELRNSGLIFTLKQVDNRELFVEELSDFAPDIVLSDFRLPNFDGLTALKIVKEEYPDIPFIMISGVIGEELAVNIVKSGAADFLLKDRMTRLASAVERALRDADKTRLQNALQEQTKLLEIESRQILEREFKIKKIKRDLEELKEQIKELEAR